VDTVAQDHSASAAGASPPDRHGCLCPVCSFYCRGYAHAIRYTSLPAQISGHLCAEPFFPTHPTVLQWEERPLHSVFTEGTPFFPLPDSHHLSPCHPQAWGFQHLWLQQRQSGARHTMAQPPQPGWLCSALQSSRCSSQKLIPCQK